MAREFFENRMTPESLEDQVILAAYNEAQKKFERERIQPADFKDLYSEESIDADLRLTQKLQEKFEKDKNHETVQLALILEEIFSEQIELNEWLGSGVTTQKASRYDDFVNGVDEIVEIQEENSVNHLAIAVDVTFGTNLYKKFERIKSEIESGELASVKYFKNGVSKVPRVIIGTHKDKIVELAKLWMERNNKELAKHPVQLEILDEITLQLQSYKKYAEQLGKEDIAKILERQLSIAQKIRLSEDKQELRKTADLSYRTEDQVFQAIKRGAEMFAPNLQEP